MARADDIVFEKFQGSQIIWEKIQCQLRGEGVEAVERPAIRKMRVKGEKEAWGKMERGPSEGFRTRRVLLVQEGELKERAKYRGSGMNLHCTMK